MPSPQQQQEVHYLLFALRHPVVHQLHDRRLLLDVEVEVLMSLSAVRRIVDRLIKPVNPHLARETLRVRSYLAELWHIFAIENVEELKHKSPQVVKRDGDFVVGSELVHIYTSIVVQEVLEQLDVPVVLPARRLLKPYEPVSGDEPQRFRRPRHRFFVTLG